jgi:hypothetical protein
MAKLFSANAYTDGTFTMFIHPTKGISLKTGVAHNGPLSPDMAGEIIEKGVEVATKRKLSFDRWMFYVEGESQKLKKTDKLISLAVVKKALKDGFETTVEMGNFSKPRVTLRPVGSTGKTAKKSSFEEIEV